MKMFEAGLGSKAGGPGAMTVDLFSSTAFLRSDTLVFIPGKHAWIMNTRALLAFAVLAASIPVPAQESDVSIVRDLLAPPSFFEDTATGKRIEPRERLAAEGITFGKDESIAYDPVTSRLFVRSDAMTLLRLEELLEAEMRRGFAQVFLTYQVLETRMPLLSNNEAEVGDPRSDPDSGTRVGKVVDEEVWKPNLAATRIFTTGDQVDSLIRRVRGANLGTIRPPSALAAKSGQTTEAWIGDALTRNVPVISADASTVEMTLTLLQGRAGADPQIVGETKIAVFSGGTAAFEERLGETSWRTRLITAVVVDPAGIPFPQKETSGLPGEERMGLGGSLFPGPVPVPALEKVKAIILPSVEFQETPLLEAIEILRQASINHDPSLPEAQRGVNILFSYTNGAGLEKKPVTLRLSNVPLIEAIRYTTNAAGCDHRIEGGTVLIGNFVTTEPGGPEDIWYAAFLRQQEADDLGRAGRTAEAVSKCQQALKLYGVLHKKHPDFQPKAVEEQTKRVKEKLADE